MSDWRTVIGQIPFDDPASLGYVPGLMELMDDSRVPWRTRRQAAMTLGRLGPLARAAIPHLLVHLEEMNPDEPDSSPQRWALSALALFGREAKSATPSLIRLLTADGSSILTQLGCLEALSQIGSADPATIEAMMSYLECRLSLDSDNERELTHAAAEAIGYVGPDAAVAVPVLLRAAQADDDVLRHAALASLGRIGSRAEGAIPVVFDLLVDDESEFVRQAAEKTLGQIGHASWPWVQTLLDDEDGGLRERGATIVSGWTGARMEIVPRIERLLSDPEPRVRLAAAKSWRSLTRRHDLIWPVLIELLTEGDRQIRRGASQELQAIVTAGAVSDHEFRLLQSDPRSHVRQEAIRLLRLRRISK
ncbi:MAG: HEAT repeat domain-containing protein [Planctomycetaceae bacterium]